MSKIQICKYLSHPSNSNGQIWHKYDRWEQLVNEIDFDFKIKIKVINKFPIKGTRRRCIWIRLGMEGDAADTPSTIEGAKVLNAGILERKHLLESGEDSLIDKCLYLSNAVLEERKALEIEDEKKEKRGGIEKKMCGKSDFG